jgi:hypothetical protein
LRNAIGVFEQGNDPHEFRVLVQGPDQSLDRTGEYFGVGVEQQQEGFAAVAKTTVDGVGKPPVRVQWQDHHLWVMLG